ncbi:polysaccharide biosynthesis C-terminal domain-containing protein [Vibrio profundum]|uniref:MATE family efflux transporter n=1 Tax=Vibrio profundum TaxID=2910247 RepID=UPI003D135DAB
MKHTIFQDAKVIIKFSSPIVISSLLGMVSNFIGVLFVSGMGNNQLAAGSLAIVTVAIFTTLTFGILCSVGIKISHIKGAGESPPSIGLWVKNGFWLAVIFAFPSSLLLNFGPDFLMLVGQKQSIVVITKGYFYYSSLMMFPALINVAFLQFFIGIGKPRFILISSLVQLPINIGLFYFLISGSIYTPPMGLSGVSCSILISQTLCCLTILYYIYINEEIKGYKVYSNFLRIDWEQCKELVKVGYPIGIQKSGEIGALAVATYMMGSFGLVALTASEIVSQYTMITVIFTASLSQSISILTSKSHGEGKTELTNNYIKSSLLLMIAIFILFSLAFSIKPSFFVNAYLHVLSSDNRSIINLTIDLFIITTITMFIDGTRNLLSGALRGLQDSRTPMLIGTLSLWLISLPLAYILGFVESLGPVGLKIGFVIGIVITTLILGKVYLQRMTSLSNQKAREAFSNI